MLFDPADFVLVNSVGASGLSLAANAKAANGLFDSRLAPTQIAAVASRLENAVRYLFTKYSGVPASWYDPSDMSTLFQDDAGTVPVTAVEQPVGLQLDKSGRGYHRSQTTATKRPVLSRRVNLLESTELYTGASWTRAGSGGGVAPVVINADTTGPSFSGFASKVTFSATGSEISSLYRGVSYLPGAYTSRLMLKAATPADVGKIVGHRHAGGSDYQLITLAANYQEFGRSETTASNYAGQYELVLRPALGTSSGEVSVHVAYFDLKSATDAHLPYQRVTTASDYDADPTKFPAYLKLDGVDDAMVTAVQPWSATSAVTVSAAVQRFDAANAGIAAEAGSAWTLAAPPSASSTTAQITSDGGTAASATVNTAASYKGIVTGRANIATPSVRARFNGAAGANVATSQGSGPYANNPINWFARNQSSVYFKGNAFGEIVIGAQLQDDEVALIEKYLATKAGVTL